MDSIFVFLTVLVVGYLLGSLCFAVILSRMCSFPNPIEAGSGNPGTTNVLRLAGKKYAAYVLLADLLKGFLPIFIFKFFGLSPTILSFACFSLVLGHIYPVFFSFKGGKGVATALGCFLGLDFMMGLLLMALWLLVAVISRYASLAAIITVLMAPFIAVSSMKTLEVFPPIFLITALILYRHRHNITRLIDKKEPKIQCPKTMFTACNLRDNEHSVEVATTASETQAEQVQTEVLVKETVCSIEKETVISNDSAVSKTRKAKKKQTPKEGSEK